MAQQAADVEEALELGTRLTALHEQNGAPKFTKMAKDFYKDYSIDVSDEQLREMHNGKRNPRTVRVEVLAGLVMYYGCSPTDLGSVAADRLDWLRTLDMSDWPWMHTRRGQRPSDPKSPRQREPAAA